MAVNNRDRIAISITFFVASCLAALPSTAQNDSTIDRKKLRAFVAATGAAYVAGIAGLNYVWYKNTERQSFRFFNDNAEWKQLDKAGHFFSSYYLSALPAAALRNCNMRRRKSTLYGAITGFLLTIPIEVMDGFSDGYGASPGDAIADAAGPAAFLAQQFAWGEARIIPKLSFHRTGYAPLNPDLLGDNAISELVKDYNGQTFWLSFDVDKFTRFPAWLNIAVGYGGQEMVNARDEQNKANGFDAHRQYYLAVDLDLTAIRTRSKVARTLLQLASIIRLPAPALEFSRKGSKFHPFYF
jgi:uncharacterized protein YfiM (DUF2279 family)